MQQSFTYGNSFIAIEHTFSEEKEQFHFLFLKKKKNEFFIEKSKTAKSLDALLSEIPKLCPVVITINNQHTLQKVVSQHFSSTEAAANFCFPALEQDAFYIETLAVGKNTLVTVCRKQIVTDLLTYYRSKNITVLRISLGNSNIHTLLPYMETNRFYTTNLCLEFDTDHSVTNLQTDVCPPPTHYTLNGLQIDNHFVLGLAGLTGLLTKEENNNNFNQLNAALFKTFVHSRIYFYGIRSSIALLFCLLLLNTFLFISYQKKTSELNQETLSMQQEASRLEVLKENVQRHKNLVTNLTENSNSKAAFYLDAIAAGVPKSVLLRSLNYQPILKKVKAGKKIMTDPNKIIITGTVMNGNDFTSWIQKLASEPWVQTSRVIDYGTGKENEISFSLQLTL